MESSRVAVVPYRSTQGRIEVMLVTTKGSGRWIVPRGHVEPHLGVKGSAELEAYEEAGVAGRLHVAPLGVYHVRARKQREAMKVYLLQVTRVLDEWPEADKRERRWMLIRDALALVDKEMRPILHMAAEVLH